MAYGQAGTTSGYYSHTSSTGGYCEIHMRTPTKTSDYTYTANIVECETPKIDNEYYSVKQ